MTEIKNRQWRLASRPAGIVEESNFRFTAEPVPSLEKEGQILVRNRYFSLDPTQRIWMGGDSYLPAVNIGEVMRSIAAGTVEASRHPGYAPGDLVTGVLGWQDYALLDADYPGNLLVKVPPGVPPTTAMSLFGHIGLTAYFGLLDIGRPVAGETVVVSGAAGATGSIVGQIAKIKGCRAIGIAGGSRKCDYVVRELGFDACIDYKSEDVAARLRELCPEGINVYFDNVGGTILDAALASLAMRGRVVFCGAISQYDLADPPGPKNLKELLYRRGRMEGFIIIDYFSRAAEAAKDIAAWYAEGKLKDKVDVQEGFENAPAALRRLFTGENFGKQLLHIA